MSGSGDGEDGDDDDNSGSSEKEDPNEMLQNGLSTVLCNGWIKRVVFMHQGQNVPDWIKFPHQASGNTVTPANPAAEGSRKRKAVLYDDEMTENISPIVEQHTLKAQLHEQSV